MKTINTPISFTNENSQKCVVIASEGTAFALSEATPSLYRTKHLLLLLLFLTHFSFAGNFTWTGATNTDWATASNWSGNISGPPSTNDTVSIITQTNLPVLAANTTIKKFTMTSGTLDCNGFTLTISANATFNGGTINNGTLTCSGTSTLTFAGTAFGVVVNATGNNLFFNGSVFNNSLTAVKKGSSNDNSIGNNVFNGVVTLTDSGSGSIVLSNTTSAPDTFNSTLTVSARSTGAVYLAHQGTGNVFNGNVTFSTGNIFSNTYGTAAYNGNITLNSASANISFGNSTGTWTLASGKNISIGTFSAGTLTIRNLTQSDNSVNMRLALTGTGKLVLGNNSISAKLYASSNQLTFSATRFLSADTLIYTGGNNATSAGGNYFGSTVYIANIFTGNNYHFTLGSSSVDTFTTTTTIATTGNTSLDVANGLFLEAVTFKNSITGTLSDRFYVWDCTFKGALTLDGIHSAIKFKNGTGNSLIDSTATLNLVSGYAGQLTLSYIEQRGSNAINLNMSTNTSTGNNTILTIGPNAIFNSNFYYLGQRLELNGGTFNSNASFTRFSQQLDVCEGGNVFNGVTQICDSVAATTANRVFKLANTTADDFNGNVTFKQYGTGSSASTMKMYPAYTANSTFAGNVTVESNNVPIEFGANGGKVIFDGGKAQSFNKTGSNIPSFKNFQVSSSRGEVSLGYPLTLTDTLFLTNGVLSTDATNLLTLADNAKVSGGSDSSYINGPIKKIGNDAFTFPLGDISLTSGAFHALEITAPSTTGAAYTAQYFASEQTFGSSKVDTIGYLSTCEFWTLNRNADTCQVMPTIWWNSNSCNIDTGLQRIAYWNSSQWVSLGKGVVSGNSAKGSVASATKVDLFGKFTLAQVCNMTADISSSHGGTICTGVTDTITAIPSGQTSYQFFKNGTSVQTGSSNKYISSTLSNGDVIKVKVTNVGSCFSYDSLTMVVNSLPSVSITTDSTTFCKGQTHTLTASGTGLTSYLWSPGDATTSSRTVNAAGTYSVTASNGSCSNSASQVIALYDTIQPTITVIGRTTICTGATSELQATLTGAINYLWSTSETTQLITVEDSAIYQITCQDAHGCYVHNWQAMTQANNPTAPIISPTGIVNLCTSDSGTTNTSVTLHTTNYSTNLTWSSSEITQDIVVDYEDNFNVIYTDPTSGCSSVSNTASTIVSSYSVLPSTITTNKTGNEVCKGDSITLTENSGVLGTPIYEGDSTAPTYWAWYIGGCGDSLVGTGASITVHPIEDTKYYLRAEGPCGTVCDSVLVKCMSISLSATNEVCRGYENGDARVLVEGGWAPYQYSWSPKISGSSALWGLKPGYYHVEVSDSLGCVLTDSVQVGSPDTMYISILTTLSSCNDSTGTAKIITSGGNGSPYYFFWTPEYEDTDSIASLAAGIYEVKVSDNKGCTIDTVVAISDENGPEVEIDSLVNVNCNGYDDGFASINCIDCEDEEFSILPPCSLPNLGQISAGQYPFIVINNSGCKTVILVNISEPDPIDVSIATTQSVCGDSTGTATAIVTGGTGVYTYQWTSGGTGDYEEFIPSGFDTLTVTDENGCTSQDVAIIADTNCFTVSVSKTDLLCSDDTSGTASITITGGTSPFHYLWSAGLPDSASLSNLQSGNYKVVVVDTNGCKQIIEFEIGSPAKLETNFYKVITESDSEVVTSARIDVIGGTPPYSYLWLPDSSTSNKISNLGNGTYSYIVTDQNQCKSSSSFTNFQAIPCPPNQSGCYAQNVWITCNKSYVGCTVPISYFGAAPSDGASDECAFEAANNYILANWTSCPTLTITFDPGTYDVGRQDFYGQDPNNIGPPLNYCMQARGHHIFNLFGVGDANHKVIFQGTTIAGTHTTIRYENCMRYGLFEFDPSNNYTDRLLPASSADITWCRMADPGNLFQIINSQNIEINDLELDGNLPNLAVGGATATDAGINLGHFGILIDGDGSGGQSKNVTIRNVNCHDFGYCGIESAIHNAANIINLRMYNSKFNRNGCSGFAWESGSLVRAYNCQFDRNAVDRIRTFESSGIDIENQGGTPTRNGTFVDCQFRFNSRTGVQNTFGGSPKETDYNFIRCTFVGGEFDPVARAWKDGNPICLNSARTHFSCCKFYGPINYGYDENFSAPFGSRMIFWNCTFDEEYTDPDDGRRWSFNMDCMYNSNPPYCAPFASAGPKWYLVALGVDQGPKYRRTTFNSCSFSSNYSMSLCQFHGGYNPAFAMVVRNCNFYNGGLNDAPMSANCGLTLFPSNSVLFNMAGTRFIGNNSLIWHRTNACQTGGLTRNNSLRQDYYLQSLLCYRNQSNIPTINIVANPIWPIYFQNGCTSTGVSPQVVPFVPAQTSVINANFDDCTERFTNYEYTGNLLLNLFSATGSAYTLPLPAACYGAPRLGQISQQSQENIKGKILISPIPTSSLIEIQNANIGDEIQIYDVLGNLLLRKSVSEKVCRINLSEIANGIYFVKASNSEPIKIIKAYDEN